jgi:hypothetical protein
MWLLFFINYLHLSGIYGKACSYEWTPKKTRVTMKLGYANK